MFNAHWPRSQFFFFAGFFLFAGFALAYQFGMTVEIPQ